jgi:hypothetical protein
MPPRIRGRGDAVAAGGELRRRNGSGLTILLMLLLASRYENVWLSEGTPDKVGVDDRGGGERDAVGFDDSLTPLLLLEILSVRLAECANGLSADFIGDGPRGE